MEKYLVLKQWGKILEWIFLLIPFEHTNKVLSQNENDITEFNVAKKIT